MSHYVIDFEGIPDYADESCYVEFADADGGAYDWTSSTFRMIIGKRMGGASPLVELTQADGDIVPSVVGGKSRITWRFRPEKLENLSGAYYHAILETVGGRDRLFGKGSISIEKAPS